MVCLVDYYEYGFNAEFSSDNYCSVPSIRHIRDNQNLGLKFGLGSMLGLGSYPKFYLSHS